MPDFELVEEFQRFLEEQDPEFVKSEMHFFAENNRRRGAGPHTALYPIFLNPRITEMYRRFSKLVWNAVERVVETVTENSVVEGEALRDFLNVDNVLRQLLDYKPKGGRMPRIIRPDTVYSGGIQTYEVNVSWPGGLFRVDLLLQGLDENTLYRRFREQMNAKGIHIHNPRKNYNSSLVLDQLVDASGKEKPYIAVIVPRNKTQKEDLTQIKLHTWFRDYSRERGFDCDIIFPDEFEYDGYKASFRGRPIDVAYRIFEWHHVLGDEKDDQGYRRVVQAEVAGSLPVVNSFASELVSAKSLLEVFWDDRFRNIFDEGELDELRQYIPRTANLARVAPEVVRDVLENRERWVLKPVKGSSGRGVYVGKDPEVSIQDWRRTVEQRGNGRYTIQEYVESPAVSIAVVRGDKVVQIPRYVDLNPPIIGGRMGHFVGRYSQALRTATMGAPDVGGLYPILTYEKASPALPSKHHG